ncbi:MAG: hypothetical protein JOZ81_28825 [Chloroflexi bacterium]|nr:hypothetical protein [Chloroflexota bacterium]MBV9547058.1 hypothetical protein [Chloroflexota bacterium]
MVVLLHGALGGWDELVIAVVAFAVLWVAVKIAGRKSAGDTDIDEDETEPAEPAEVAKPPASHVG